MSTRRGKKINPTKNYVSAKDFAAGKRIGRPKQVFDPATKTWAKGNNALESSERAVLSETQSDNNHTNGRTETAK
jgi:hypothetical protein